MAGGRGKIGSMNISTRAQRVINIGMAISLLVVVLVALLAAR
jgi:hypothetical protein